MGPANEPEKKQRNPQLCQNKSHISSATVQICKRDGCQEKICDNCYYPHPQTKAWICKRDYLAIKHNSTNTTTPTAQPVLKLNVENTISVVLNKDTHELEGWDELKKVLGLEEVGVDVKQINALYKNLVKPGQYTVVVAGKAEN